MFKQGTLTGASIQMGLGMFCIFLIAGSVNVWGLQRSTSQSHWQGREVFRGKGCVQCHSVYGKNGKVGPDLGKEKFYGTYLELAALMWNHFPRMYGQMQEAGFPFQALTRTEMTDLIAYLSYIRFMGESGSEYSGRKLLQSKGCLSCHQLGGAGTEIGPDISKIEEYLTPVALVEAMWNHGPNMKGMFEEQGISRPKLSGEEIVDLATVVRAYMTPTRVPAITFELGDAGRGKTILEAKGCMHCHSFRGAGGSLGPDFLNIKLDSSVTEIAAMMWNHGPIMWDIMERHEITYPTFEKGEMADLIAYLYSLMLEDEPGNAEIGSAIVKDRGCLKCHSLRGDGPAISKDLADVGNLQTPVAMITAMWNHAPEMQKKFEGKKLQWPELHARDMANLYAFLGSISRSSAASD